MKPIQRPMLMFEIVGENSEFSHSFLPFEADESGSRQDVIMIEEGAEHDGKVLRTSQRCYCKWRETRGRGGTDSFNA